MARAIGAGIPAPSNVARRGWGFQLHRRAEDIGQCADERKPLFALANNELRAISEAIVYIRKQQAKSDLRMVEGVRFRSKERSNVVRNRAMAGPHGP